MPWLIWRRNNNDVVRRRDDCLPIAAGRGADFQVADYLDDAGLAVIAANYRRHRSISVDELSVCQRSVEDASSEVHCSQQEREPSNQLLLARLAGEDALRTGRGSGAEARCRLIQADPRLKCPDNHAGEE